jgi:predicted  nucleic acid-binding Zn-ribbon protein
MHALIENLVKLQAIELDRARLTLETRALPVEITRAEAALAAAERQSADASAALSREETLRNRLEREIETHRQKAARFQAQNDSVTTSAQAEAIKHEIQFASTEITRLEDEEFASLERTEAQETVMAGSRAQVEFLAVALERTRERVALRQQELAAEIAALNTDREATRCRIEPEWLTRFDRLAASRGTGIARAEDQQCTGCRMGIRPQTWNQLREGELLNCDSCGRLLYWDPAMTPAPKAPQPEAIPGAGRAIRKSPSAGD